jgi:hypothetical protein
MALPRFSIVIPTKNRPDRLANAVRSVVGQTFPDLDIVVCDNSDPPDAERSAAVVSALSDSRVRYVRTNGRLSMPDNWEFGCARARGEYVSILTDRSVFRSDALEIVNDEIQKTGAPIVTWWCDTYGRDPAGRHFRRRHVSGARYRMSRADVLNLFLHGDPKSSTKFLPKLMTACCHHTVLEAIRRSPAGRCFLPVSPDYTSGFLLIGHADWMLMMEEALYVSCGSGNGASFRRKGELAARFLADLGLAPGEIVDRMPSRAVFSHAAILNDFMRVKHLVPKRFEGFDIDRAQYYVGCLFDYTKSAKQGADFTPELDLLLTALADEDEDVQRAVRTNRGYINALLLRPNLIRLRAAMPGTDVAREHPEADPLAFDTVFDALAWDATHPRDPAPLARPDSPPRYQPDSSEPWWDRRMRKLNAAAASSAEHTS